MKVKILIALSAMLASAAVYADALPIAINQSHMLMTLAGFFGVGILLAFTPCVLPMVPILSAILIGQEEMGSMRALRLSLVFVFSMAVTYAAAGMLAGYLGSTLQTLMQTPMVIISFSLIFVAMALSMFGYFNLSLPAFMQTRLHNTSASLKQGSYLGVALMGVLSTLIASPCVTAPLLSVLTFISETGSAIQGGLILFTLALGMGVPLVLFGMGQSALLPKSGEWMNTIKSIFGVMMLGLAIWMMSRILPGEVTMFLWAGLLIVSAVAFGALDLHATKRLSPALHGTSVFVLVYGVLLLAGAASGHDNPFNPLGPAFASRSAAAVRSPSSLFVYVDTLPKLQQKLRDAKAAHRPVMIEFFASWCPVCKQVDREVLSDASVQASMRGVTAIRVDVSERNAALTKMMEAYQVYGVPTMIFYDKNGSLFNAELLGDGISKKGLISTLQQLS